MTKIVFTTVDEFPTDLLGGGIKIWAHPAIKGRACIGSEGLWMAVDPGANLIITDDGGVEEEGSSLGGIHPDPEWRR